MDKEGKPQTVLEMKTTKRSDTYAEFEKLSRAVKIIDTVKLMKKVVPEFKSKNSPKFEVLDKE